MNIEGLKSWADALTKAKEINGSEITGIATVEVAIAIKEQNGYFKRIAEAFEKLARTDGEIKAEAFIKSVMAKPEAQPALAVGDRVEDGGTMMGAIVKIEDDGKIKVQNNVGVTKWYSASELKKAGA